MVQPKLLGDVRKLVTQSLDPLIFYPMVALTQTLFVGTGESHRDVMSAMRRALVHHAAQSGRA